MTSIRKAPAFQFYADDFLAGTLEMSHEEVGVYIRLLCIQWSKGVVTERSVKALCAGDAADYVLSEKFEHFDDGWRNERLENIRQIAAARAQSGSKGGAKSKQTPKQNESKVEANTQANGQAKPNPPSPSPSPSPITLSLTGKTTDFRECSKHWAEEVFRIKWQEWLRHVSIVGNSVLSDVSEVAALYQLDDWPLVDAIAIIDFSILKNARNLILNGDHKRPPEPKTNGHSGRRKAPTFEEFDL